MIKSLVLALFLLVVPAVAADPTIVANGGPSVTFTYQPIGFPSSGGTANFSVVGDILTVALSNTGTEVGGDGGSIIDAFGFNSSPDVGVTSLTQSGDVSGWLLNRGPLGVLEVSSADSNGQNDRLTQDLRNTTLAFTLTGLTGDLTVDVTQLHFQSLGIGDGGSQKPAGEVSDVPEPASLFLLGLGLSAAGFLRRRN